MRDRAEGIWFDCAWPDCAARNRVIAEDSMGPGESVIAACDRCRRLTQITRRVAIFA